MKKPKVLLTDSYGPYALGWGEDMHDPLRSRFARGHDTSFAMSSHCHYFGLYLIAENITCPTTVLEHPHWEEFDNELDKGYDFVGIQIITIYTAQIARMVKHIREKCPNTKIVIGGYGVSTLDHGHLLPSDIKHEAIYIRENVDYLCREEGVRFMRRVLDDGPEDREITQYKMPTVGFSLLGSDTLIKGRLPIILVSLGCPNGCDFCVTSAFFKCKKIYVAEPEQVYRFIKNYQKRLKTNNVTVQLFDEDFFSNADYVRELGRLLRHDKKTWGVKYNTYGSVSSLSQFNIEELRDCGAGSIWIGIESFISGKDLTDDQYAKRRGNDVKKMFMDLQRNGIDVTGSMILGFDFHTPENIKEDIDQFIALKPTLYQFAQLVPCPGTALYERMLKENRIKNNCEWEDGSVWANDGYLKPRNLKKGEIKKFYDHAHGQIRNILGPPIIQVMENAMNCYSILKKIPTSLHRYRANLAKRKASGAYAFLRSIKLHHPVSVVRKRAIALKKHYHKEIGRPPLFISVFSRYVSGKVYKKSKLPPEKIVSDPPPRWSYYNTFGSDGRVYVRKGRKAKKPKPYKDHRQFLSLS